MSMYTHLLDAAYGRRDPVPGSPTEHSALVAVRRRRGELAQGGPPPSDPDAVPVVLARQISYDVALLELADLLGIETHPSRFERPWQERARLEQALREHGYALHPPPETEGPALGPI